MASMLVILAFSKTSVLVKVIPVDIEEAELVKPFQESQMVPTSNPNSDPYFILILTYIYIYFVVSSVWLDTRYASNWVRNPADFTPVGYLTAYYQQPQRKRRDLTYMYYFSFVYIYAYQLRSTQFIRRALLYASGNR